MTADDLVDSLRSAIGRADPQWVSQPSHLRRRLDEVLGADARTHRARVHQLVVAAEERVPVRLERGGWSPAARDELTSKLVSSRGWTVEAADWAVLTWAAALGLTDERPHAQEPSPGSCAQPGGAARATDALGETRTGRSDVNAEATALPEGTLVPDTTALPSLTIVPDEVEPPGAATRPVTPPHFADPTALPEALPPVASAPVRSTPESITPASPPPVPAAASAATPVPSAQLPTKGTAKCTARTAAFLERDIDVAYEASTGASPAWLMLALPIGLAAFASSMLAGPLLMAFTLVIVIGQAVWPKRILAIDGDRVWVLTARGRRVRPTGIESESSRDEVENAGGILFPSVRVAGRQLWFRFPIARAARLVSTQSGGAT